MKDFEIVDVPFVSIAVDRRDCIFPLWEISAEILS
jgi:hypothetical protein